MHRTTASVAPIDFLYPQSHSNYSRQAPFHSQLSTSSADNLHPRAHGNSHLDIQDNSLTYKNLQKLPQAIAGLSKVVTGYTDAPVRDGLRTPPEDDMNSTTACQSQQFPIYRPQDPSYSYSSQNAVSTSAPSRSVKTQPSTTYQRAAEYDPQQSRSLTAQALSNIPQQVPYSRQPTHSPKHTSTSSQTDDGRGKSVVLPSLQIPPSINNSGGSLGEFAAQVRLFAKRRLDNY
jgi:hypothetical protein